jgi:hypothetical protein
VGERDAEFDMSLALPSLLAIAKRLCTDFISLYRQGWSFKFLQIYYLFRH